MAADPPPSPPERSPLGCVVVVLLIAALTWLRSLPPDPAPADAPADVFSGARARVVLERIAGDQVPHGVGTPANAEVRERIAAELTALGLEVERQAAFSCRGIVCAPVVNLLAEVPGVQADGPFVLLTSHYDSVHAGPGVADDLHGVAVGIETARALLAGDPPEHPVRLLIDEGEEVGLLGAAAFVDRHPDLDRVGVVVNAEARGTAGMSSLFETSRGNAQLVAAYADAAPLPRATSLAYEVYERMPNDTDLSVFKRAGLPGLNFAFVGEGGWYHTPLDDLAHLDDGSMQHQGDNVLGVVRSLAAGPLPRPAANDAIYADVLSFGVVTWPSAWVQIVPAMLLAALVLLAVVARSRGRARALRLLLGPAVLLGSLVLTGLLAWGLAALVATIHGESLPAHAHRWPLRLSLWAVALVVALALGTLGRRRARPLELALGLWMTWAVLAWTLAITIPGASVALCIPVGMAVLGLTWALASPRREPAALTFAGVAMVALWTMLALGLEEVFGFALVPAIAAPIAVAVSGMIPALGVPPGARRSTVRIAAAAVLGTTLWACAVPIYDAERPRRIAINHYDDRSAGLARLAVLAVDPLPPALREAGSLHDGAHPVLPWTGRALHEGPATPGDEPAPELKVVEGGAHGEPRHVRARLRSLRGADRAVVMMPREHLHRVHVEGRRVDTATDGRLLVFGLPAGGVILDLELSPQEAVEATVIDCKAGIPASSAAVVQARDAADAVTVQWGDVGCIGTRVTL